jgi:cobalamin biosynthesis Mg chelatase CobN
MKTKVFALMLGLFVAGSLASASAYAASPATTAPPTTVGVTTTVATTSATTVATTVPPTTATTSVTTTTEPSTTTTTTSSTSTTARHRIVVGIAATRGIVITEENSGSAQSGWIAFGILLAVVFGVGIGWWVRERHRQGAGSADKPVS